MASLSRTPREITNGLIRLLDESGTGEYIGENISQLEHCLQCANSGVKLVRIPD